MKAVWELNREVKITDGWCKVNENHECKLMKRIKSTTLITTE